MTGKQAIAFNWGRSGMRAALAAGSAIVLIVGFMCGAVRADDDDVLREVLDAAVGHDQSGWAYTRTMNVLAGTVDEREKVMVTEKFDPSKPPGEQRERMEVSEDSDGKITTEYNDGLDVDVDRVVYANLAEIEFESAELVSDSADEAVYRLYMEDGQNFEFGDASFGGESLMDAVYGELVVQKTGTAAPFISEVRVKNTDNSGSLWADIEKLDISFRFMPSPDGTTYLNRGLDLELELELLIFIDIDVDVVSNYSDYAYVGEYGS